MAERDPSLPKTKKMPAVFVGHGSPLNAIEDNPFSRQWRMLGRTLARPHAILAISAHWQTLGKTLVTRMVTPPTLHDFGGFPQALYDQQYPAPGSLALADTVMRTVTGTRIIGDQSWGLDHGTWSVLLHMYPKADIPVVQLSIDLDFTASQHIELGKALHGLRRKGVMVMGSGNLVHNLSAMARRQPYDWALAFDARIKALIDDGDLQAVAGMPRNDPRFKNAHPTPDHFVPVLYVLGARDPDDGIRHFNEAIDLASVSMRGFVLD